MKHFLETFIRIARGYGGMLFIAILGLSTLIFGGILSNVRQARELRTAIDDLNRAREEQVQLRSLLVSIESQHRAIQHEKLPVSAETLTVAEIPEVAAAFESFAAAAGLRLDSVRHLLQPPSDGPMSLRIEVRLAGNLPGFRTFLEEMLTWEYRSQIEGFSILATETEQQIQLVVGIAVT